MKKKLLIICVVVLALIAVAMSWYSAQKTSPQPDGDVVASEANKNTDNANTTVAVPAEVKISIFDPSTSTPSVETSLLEKRLRDLGFQVAVTNLIPISDTNMYDRSTILYRSGSEDKLKLVRRIAVNAGVVRQIQNDSFSDDILVASWNLDDISWGAFKDEAAKLMHPDASSVAITVINAGAESGTAGKVADLLKSKGFVLAEAQNTDISEIGLPLVYYRRNFKEVAKEISVFMKSGGYPETTYRARQDQQVPIVVVIPAPEGSVTATTTPEQ